jgi:hypothetical protein
MRHRHGYRVRETKVWTDDEIPGQRVQLILMARPPGGVWKD